MKTIDNTSVSRTTSEIVVLHDRIIPQEINWDEIVVIDHLEKDIKDWFIALLKKEESTKPNWSETLRFYEIGEGPEDIYYYFYKTNRLIIKAQPILALCFDLKERYRSQKNNIYYCILQNEDNNKFFIKMAIAEKIKIQRFPYKKKSLEKSNDKKNLVLHLAN